MAETPGKTDGEREGEEKGRAEQMHAAKQNRMKGWMMSVQQERLLCRGGRRKEILETGKLKGRVTKRDTSRGRSRTQ